MMIQGFGCRDGKTVPTSQEDRSIQAGSLMVYVFNAQSFLFDRKNKAEMIIMITMMTFSYQVGSFVLPT